MLKDKRILCLCEGAAEYDIMNLLLENELLIINKEDLYDEKLHYRKRVRDIEDQFLGYSHQKELIILRVIDSKNEQFNLKKAYANRYRVINIITNPEIEILIIIDKADLDEFNKTKSTKKASEFCKEKYKLRKIKKSGTMREYFNDVRKLTAALKRHKSNYGKDIYTIYDLLQRT